MNTDVQKWIEYIKQQIAAESYLDGISELSVQEVEERLTLGANNHYVPLDTNKPHNTRMLGFQAEAFLEDYEIVDHLPNRSSGFSATLIRSIETDEYTLSMRSTEYRDEEKGGDWNRDGVFAADGNISFRGFALAQLASMEDYYDYLKSSGKLPPDSVLNVTGYSLSGHLATVFTEIHPEVNETYIFNGAGRGDYDASVGNLKSMIDEYRAQLVNPVWNGAQGVGPEDTEYGLYQQYEAALAEPIGLLPEDIDSVTSVIPVNPTSATLPNIYGYDRQQYAANAVWTKYDTQSLLTTDTNRTLSSDADSKITQIYGHARHGDTEIVANNGVNSSNEVEILIED